jgi:hypothetical protein
VSHGTRYTPRQAIDLIASKIENGSSTKFEPSTPRDKVRTLLRQITREKIGIKEFSDDDEFVRDLGLD